jgi:hypothetical protein
VQPVIHHVLALTVCLLQAAMAKVRRDGALTEGLSYLQGPTDNPWKNTPLPGYFHPRPSLILFDPTHCLEELPALQRRVLQL